MQRPRLEQGRRSSARYWPEAHVHWLLLPNAEQEWLGCRAKLASLFASVLVLRVIVSASISGEVQEPQDF